MTAAVVLIDGGHQEDGKDVRPGPPERDGGAAALHVAACGMRQQQHDQRDAHELFRQMHGRGLSDAPAGREIPGDRGAERDTGHGQRRDAQREHGARIADPEKAERLGQKL